ncbi:MAG: membrane-bound lytic murein transglycosylase MltF [Sulfurimonas sp.]|nr:membrane-bound lytic murein transglycosylase MltF [Sulfurimonas sp.]
MKKTPNSFSLVLFALSFFVFGWLSHSAYLPIHEIQYPSILEKIKKDKLLNVVLLNSPSTFYIGTDGEQGFEYDLLKAYADYLGVGLNITVAHTTKEAIELSKNPDIHITSAALAKTPLREDTFNFGPAYLEVQQQVICYRGMLNTKNFPNDVEGLAGLRIMIGEDTSYSETIQALQNEGFDLNVTLTAEYSTEELLQKVSQNEIDCTIADSNVYSINLRYFPEIAMAFTISGREQLAWVLAPNSKGLASSMYEWLNSFNQSGAMAALKDHHSGYIMFFDYYNTKMFYNRIKTRLPKFQELFSKASSDHNVSWTLLAAIGYQESHWNPNAKSFTGVRGLMMLTNNTAKMLGVADRVDPSQSIDGGTRHIVEMLKLVPPEVEGENRLKFALAAYNVGMAHIEDAMLLAKKLNLNENVWSELKKVLPLLAQKKYYKDLKYGYARGDEPVKYVESIYNYKDILENAFEESSRVNVNAESTKLMK